jgi:16S rRNA (adenine1518-N6/adenine1519-N6)-dimethyltransferase
MSDGAPEWEDPRRVLARHGIEPKRAWSQNFLVARPTVERIVQALGPAENEPVVELGPGLGTLTTALLRSGGHVIAIERDRDMRTILQAELGPQQAFELVDADASDIDLTALGSRVGQRLALVGNLPYAITGQILKNLIHHRQALSRAILMIQREVRDRLVAPPSTKAYGALSVFVGASFRVESVLRVKPGAFHPPPKVSSSVVRLVPYDAPLAEETPAFQQIVRGAFAARRKTLRNALLQLPQAHAERVDRVLTAAGIDGRRRGETLSIQQFDALARAWASDDG